MLGNALVLRSVQSSAVRSHLLTPTRLLTSTGRRLEEIKTPIQQIGWEYLMKQKSLGRPISPHLNIYKPQLTWMMSGFHRISGCVMAGTLLVGGLGFAFLPFDFTTFIEFVHSLNLPCVITATFKFIIAFPIVFHTLNGIRFIGFDYAKGVDNIGQIYKSGWLVLGLSTLIALIVVANSCMNRDAKKAAARH
ncbi:hypothetical protein WR25_05428 [Diploscapter pachys]|uniref:Succinate dehydrogenase cytochrome b560 subunit, mitochondrial n=1 Tax=Diploscapter pachys TaxID=2018661 RepID=A0A2A2LL63_9BILA|nr:hypothetical protein WR25_05428 [Diploscapter pachys]